MNVQRCEDNMAGLHCALSTNYTYIKQHKIPTSNTEIQLPPTIINAYILHFLHYNSKLAQKWTAFTKLGTICRAVHHVCRYCSLYNYEVVQVWRCNRRQ
jgi:hypothetical protein